MTTFRPALFFASLLLAVLPVLTGCDRQDKPQDARTSEEGGASKLAPVAEDPLLQHEEEPGDTQRYSASGNYLAGKVAYNRRDMHSAVAFMQETLTVDDSNKGLAQQTFFLLLSQGKTKEYLDYARKVRAINQDDFFANLTLAMDAFQRKQWSETRRFLDSMADSEFRQMIAPLVEAWLDIATGKQAAAISSLRQAAAKPETGNLWQIHESLIAWQRRDYAEALRLFDSARQNVTVLPLRYAILYAQLLQQRKPDALDSFIRDYMAQNPDDELSQTLLDYVRNGYSHDIVFPATPAQGMAQALFDVAGILNRNQSRNIAVLMARLSVEMDPDAGFARLLLGNMLEAEGRFGEALTIYNGFSATSPFSWVAVLRRALVLDSQKKTDDAIRALSALLQQHPDLLGATIEMGDILRREERFAEAIAVYTDALKKLPEEREQHWSLYYARGICHERTRQWALAEKDLFRALELKPDQPYVLNYLAYSWVEQGINLEKAETMLRKALEQVPNDAYIMDSYAWVKFRQGNYQEAVSLLEQAIEIKPQDATLNEHLGDVYWRAGRHNEARFQWNRALLFKPEKDKIPAIKIKLEQGLTDGDAIPASTAAPHNTDNATTVSP